MNYMPAKKIQKVEASQKMLKTQLPLIPSGSGCFMAWVFSPWLHELHASTHWDTLSKWQSVLKASDLQPHATTIAKPRKVNGIKSSLITHHVTSRHLTSPSTAATTRKKAKWCQASGLTPRLDSSHHSCMFCLDGNKLNDKQKLVLLNKTHLFLNMTKLNKIDKTTRHNRTLQKASLPFISPRNGNVAVRLCLRLGEQGCASFNLLDRLEACNVINVTWTHFIIISLSIKQSQTLVFFQDTSETSCFKDKCASKFGQ